MWSIFTSHNFFYKKIKKIKIGVDKIKILCYYIRVVITTNDYIAPLLSHHDDLGALFIYGVGVSYSEVISTLYKKSLHKY
jgi:hypothetical protein